MMTFPSFLAQIESTRLFAILRAPRGLGPATVRHSVQALQRGGVQILEATLNSPGALEAIATLRAEFPALLVGAGTVLSDCEAQDAIAAGAQFLVTPTLEIDVLRIGREREIPIVCGAYTPSEMLAAHRGGAALVKIFPATALGPNFVRDLRGPLPFLKLAAVGGVTPENARQFLDAGCIAVGAGSALFDPTLAAEGRWDELEHRAQAWFEALR